VRYQSRNSLQPAIIEPQTNHVILVPSIAPFAMDGTETVEQRQMKQIPFGVTNKKRSRSSAFGEG
jgi:hypothetical protein